MKNILPLFLITLILGACRTNPMTIGVNVPAPVSLTNKAKKVGVLNRAQPDEKAKVKNAAHQIIAIQSFAMLREGSRAAIQGLTDGLKENERFEIVKKLDKEEIKTDVIGVFKAPLNWGRIDGICKANGVDALFILESFDTELKVATPVPADVSSPTQVISAAQNVQMTTIVKTGWRLYDPITRQVVDQFNIHRSQSFNGSYNPLAAVDALIQRKEAIKQMANTAGRIYSERLLQGRIRVSRRYYVRGNNNLKIGMRRARAGNWDGAAEIWKKETKNSKAKVAGRAHYNMAISNEINGNLDGAIAWAQLAYEDYKVKPALDYLRILRNRKREAELLEMQNNE